MCANSLPSHVIMQIIIKFLEENSISKIFSNLFRTKETQSRPASTRRQSAAIIFIYFSPTNVITSDANIFLIFSILNTSDFFSFFIGTICSAGCRCLVSGGCMNVCTFAPPYTFFFCYVVQVWTSEPNNIRLWARLRRIQSTILPFCPASTSSTWYENEIKRLMWMPCIRFDPYEHRLAYVSTTAASPSAGISRSFHILLTQFLFLSFAVRLINERVSTAGFGIIDRNFLMPHVVYHIQYATRMYVYNFCIMEKSTYIPFAHPANAGNHARCVCASELLSRLWTGTRCQ